MGIQEHGPWVFKSCPSYQVLLPEVKGQAPHFLVPMKFSKQEHGSHFRLT